MTDKIFIQALKGQKTNRVPFWFMRQAGRYLPEYRDLRARKNGFLAMAMDPQAAAEVTIQPIRRFGMDAAIIFSDILTIPYALGQNLEFVQGEGPKLSPVFDKNLKLGFDDFEKRLAPVYAALAETKSGLIHEGFKDTALIGFAGAPWTVATYMVEGGSSRDFMKTKLLAYRDPERFSQLINLLVEATSIYLIKQIEAGAEALQIFDSWASALDADQFVRWVMAPAKEIVKRVKAVHPDIPIIGFPKGAGALYPLYAQETGVDALGLDSAVPLDWAKDTLQSLCPVQGNLDPLCLMAGGDGLYHQTQKILETLSNGPFVFNLGHGINKDTPIAHVEALARQIKSYRHNR